MKTPGLDLGNLSLNLRRTSYKVLSIKEESILYLGLCSASRVLASGERVLSEIKIDNRLRRQIV